MQQHARWSWIWGAFTAAVIGTFTALEAVALTRHTMPTYTNTLARWFGCSPAARRRPLTIGIYAAASGWLAMHLWSYQDPEVRMCPPSTTESTAPAAASTAAPPWPR